MYNIEKKFYSLKRSRKPEISVIVSYFRTNKRKRDIFDEHLVIVSKTTIAQFAIKLCTIYLKTNCHAHLHSW